MTHHRAADHYTRLAKAQGKAARSVFKLEEIDQRFHILHPGDVVLDLGSAPGSWLQYASQQVGPKGKVVGYDLKPLEIPLPANGEFSQSDVFQLEVH